MALDTRLVGLVALLALVPVVAFTLGKSVTLSGTVTAVNVLIIAACLWLATGPAEVSGHAH